MKRLTALERFWPKVDMSAGLFDCWPWIAAIDPKGYGRFRGPDGRTTSASRFALQLKLGRPLGPDEQARHVVCDNPPCCNPAHLEPGTNADNMADMVAHERHFSKTKPERLARGDGHGSRLHPERRAVGERNGAHTHPERIARGDRNGARLHPERVARGERHGSAKLTAAQVAEIRRVRRDEGTTYRVLADRYGISEGTLSGIFKGRLWNLPEAQPCA